MTAITVNGNSYSDDGSTPNDMQYGGFQDNLLPMVGDAMIDTAAKVAAAAHQVDLAEAAAASAALSASTAVTGPGSSGTSTTTLTQAMGTQSLVIQTGKTLSPSMPITIGSTANPKNWMNGTLISYNSGTGALVVNVTNLGFANPGTPITASAWTISLSGVSASTGVINEIKGADVASSASTSDIWGAGGNMVSFTGSATVTAFPAAPNAGAARTLLITGSPTFTNGANLIVKGGTYTAGAGDEVEVEAETTTTFRLTVRRADGTPTVPTPGFRNLVYVSQSSTFVLPVTAHYQITLKGADGSGAVAKGADSTHAVAATGGASGGDCSKLLRGSAGDALTIILSAGATGVAQSGATTAAINGNTAGNSTITGPGISMQANGGGGGNATIATGSATAAGAVGGAATGGDVNHIGGGSGAASASAVNSAAATGGGASGIRGTGYGSGAASATSGLMRAATGGAGVGGASGSATSTAHPAVSAGAGSMGPSTNNTDYSTQSTPGKGAPAVVVSTPLNLTGAGGTAGVSPGDVPGTTGGPGAGSGGMVALSVNNYAPQGGALAGGGAIVGTSIGGSGIVGTVDSTSGPSGACAVTISTSAAVTAFTGNGGNAFAIIEWS